MEKYRMNDPTKFAERAYRTTYRLDSKSKHLNLRKRRKSEMCILPLDKERALFFYDIGFKVYFVYPHNEKFKECRKVCRDREALMKHYDVHHECCGIRVVK